MPTSNGQITSRDIRQKAVKTLHIVDENVVEDKIADLAVTTAKIEDYVDLASSQDYVGGVGLTTSWQNTATATIDVPAWADQLTIYGTYFTRIIAGSDQELYLAVQIDNANTPTGLGAGGAADSGERETVYHPFSTQLSGVAGSTVSVYGFSRVSTGSTTADLNGIELLAIFKR